VYLKTVVNDEAKKEQIIEGQNWQNQGPNGDRKIGRKQEGGDEEVEGQHKEHFEEEKKYETAQMAQQTSLTGPCRTSALI
jgi:hypothetical protein